MKKTLFSVLLAVTAFAAHAETFPMTNLPQGWKGSIEVAGCAEGKCSGEGRVKLKINGRTYALPADFYEFDAPKAQGAALLENPVTVDDFNFDGREDIAVPVGHQGPYGSEASDIYVQTAGGRLVKSDELSDLTHSYMGTPETDRKRKLLIVSGKSGAAIHYTEHYRVVTGKGLQQVYQRTDTHYGCNKNTGIKVEEKAMLPNGKWRTRNRCLTEAQFEKLTQQDQAEMERRSKYRP
ncbi:hypothetical protein [Neisseria sp.]|uniref:XAC2610-related protein n=1 Tax=Neisseria sp. TaxID=192066 RepID=UPI0026DCEB6A|nr:hypothetical protein [Neisseria sp.]MDO4225876.1 hypothetical protein [Neisseria sp.]